jgi:hypothetical protein
MSGPTKFVILAMIGVIRSLNEQETVLLFDQCVGFLFPKSCRAGPGSLTFVRRRDIRAVFFL